MSDIREELLGAGINKKRVIGVILVALLLVSVFAFSTFFFSFLFGTQRLNPNKEKADTEWEDAELTKPPYPFDEDFFKDLFDDLSPDELEDLMDMLEEMMDSSIDDLDLSDFSEALLALLGSQAAQQEVFRIYDYDSFSSMTSKFWRYECFDEFTGDQWHSTAATNPYDFTTWLEYFSLKSLNPSLDNITLKMPLSPNLGTNSMVIPSFFPIPFIMEDSVYADNLDLGSVSLYKTDFNCTTMDLDFTSEDPVNMTYELFGLNLPSNDYINNSDVEAQYTPIFIKNKYLQLPPSIDTYINTHPYFKSHYDVLDSKIEDTDQTFVVANKIRNYLQSNFTVGYDDLTNDPPADGEDIVEWFCEHEEGLWPEFASAFCAFARAFNVSSRFVDGFNSWGIEEGYDIDEGKDYFAIKYLNLYNWAEIYVPTSVSGEGMWVQMDIIGDSFGQGGNPMSNYNIEVYTNFTAGYRGQLANLTAILNSNTGSIDNKKITFTDYTSGLPLGEAYTNLNGTASILVNINSSFVVGPHVIIASYQLANNFTFFYVYGDIEVNLMSVNPTTINRSISNTTNIQGYVYDPIANQRVKNATVEFVLFEKGTSNDIPIPFEITFINTDNNGDFDVFTNVNPHVPRGNYEIRVDFNGSRQLPFPWGIMSNSSSRIEFNVTEELTSILLFSINGQPTDYPFFPSSVVNVKRGQQVDLSVILIDESTMFPTPGEIVEFYDYTNGDVIIGADITDAFGIASILYDIGNTNKSGPTLVYTKYGGDFNYSYYIVNESIGINVISGPDPPEIDLANPSQFNIQCELYDNSNNPIIYSRIDLKMNNSVGDCTGYLTTPHYVNPTPPGSNSFDFNRGVGGVTPIDNYTIQLKFNGYFDFSSYPYPAMFNIAYLNNSTYISKQLKVYDSNQVTILFGVEGKKTVPLYDNSYKPEIYTRGEIANFDVNVSHMGVLPAINTYITIWDDYSSMLLGNHTFDGTSGDHQFNIPTNKFYYTGIHKIKVQFMNYPTVNTTFIIINETVNFENLIISPDNVVVRDIESFTVSGYVRENGTGLRGLIVNLLLFNSTPTDVSPYLNGLKTTITSSTGYFEFNLNLIDLNCPQGPYNIRVDFNGSIYLADIPGIDPIPQYMGSNRSLPVPLNITAGAVIIKDAYYTKYESDFPDIWQNGDTLYVMGWLELDNGTALSDVFINVTVRRISDGSVVTSNASAKTDNFGAFNVSLSIDLSWTPSERSEYEIWVYFYPKDSGIDYVEYTELEFT